MKLLCKIGVFLTLATMVVAQESPVKPTPDSEATRIVVQTAEEPPDPFRYNLKGSGMKYNQEPQVRVDILMVSLPQDKALALLPALRDPDRIEAAQEQLLKWIGTKEATLVDWPEVTMHSGIRAVTETITERRYPIEFDQPTEAQTFGTMPKVKRSPPEEALRVLRLAGLLVPISFETRNTGAVAEVEAVVSPDGNAVSILLAPQVVRLEKMVRFPTTAGNKESSLAVEQPLFQTRQIRTELTLRNRERRLIYFGKPQESEGQIDLFILGATVLPNPAVKSVRK